MGAILPVPTRPCVLAATRATSVDVAGQQVVPGVAANDQAGSAVEGEHDGDPAGPVVLVGHGVAVRPGDRHGEQVTDGRVAKGDAVDQLIPGFTVPADDGDRLP